MFSRIHTAPVCSIPANADIERRLSLVSDDFVPLTLRLSMKSRHRFSPAIVVLSSSLLLGLVACQKTETTTDKPKPAMSESDTASAASSSTPAATVTFDTIEKKVSYGIGLQMGSQLARDPSLSIELQSFSAGIEDALKGGEPRINQAEIMAAFQTMQAQAQAGAQAQAQVNIDAGNAFLATNGQRPEVTTTASGLQYEVLTAGVGPKPTTDKTVRVHYHGTLLDGTVFHSSVQRGEPIEFPVTGVIPGWIEALQLMPKGSKWKLFIPANLAYGNRATGKILPGSTLVFEVELIEIL